MKKVKTKVLAVFMAIIVLGTIAAPAIGKSLKKEQNQVNTVEIVNDLGEVITIEQGNPSNTEQEVEKLVTELEETLSELDELSKVTDEVLVASYVKQELQQLRSDVEQLDIDQGIKNSLLAKLDAASKKNDQAMQFIVDREEKQANNMLKAASNILDAFINEVEAQNGKKIAEEDAEKLIQHAQKIRNGIEKGAQWIIEEKIYVEMIYQPIILAEIEKNVMEIREIIAKLQALGVQIDVIVEERSPAVVAIVIAGVKYVLAPAAAAALMTYGVIMVLEEIFGPMCWECQLKMYIVSITIAPITAAVFVKTGIGLISAKGAATIVGFTALRSICITLWMSLHPCNNPECMFERYTLAEAIEKLEEYFFPRTYEQTITDAPGMDEYRWYNQDFGWTHTFNLTGKRIVSAKLEIRAWDVDWGEAWYMEHDVIYIDGYRIGELKGRSNAWSITTFEIDPALATEILEDGEMYVFVDIDSTHTYYFWAVTIDWSKLTIEWV